jgi:hypothetical protein
MKNKKLNARRIFIIRCRNLKQSYATIGRNLGISRQAVEQIFHNSWNKKNDLMKKAREKRMNEIFLSIKD